MKKRRREIVKNPFSIFITSQYSFEGQLPDEHVIAVVRKHWFVLMQKLLLIFFFALMPLLIAGSLGSVLSGELLIFFWFLAFMFYLYLWYAAFFQLMLYLMDIWIITDHRIIDSEQYWLFSRSVAELNLSKIQDMSVDVNGLFPTVLNFGNLEVQTAAEESKFHLKGVPNPIAVKDIITKASSKYNKLHPDHTESG